MGQPRRHLVLFLLAPALAFVCALALMDGASHSPRSTRSDGRGPDAKPRDIAAPTTPRQRRIQQAVQRHEQAQRVLVGAQHISGSAPLTTQLGRRFDLGAKVAGSGTTVTAIPIRGRHVARSISKNGTATYLDAWPGVDVVQQPGIGWLKESLVVHDGALGTDRRGSYSFQLGGHAIPHLASSGDITFTDSGTPIALRIPAPLAVDANGKRLPKHATSYALSGRRLELRVAVPTGAAFPVTVDPTFAMGQGADHVVGAGALDNPTPRFGRNSYGFFDPRALASGGGKFLVGDYNWSAPDKRISVYNSIPTVSAAPEDTGWWGGTQIQGLWTNGTKVIVSDQVSNQLRIYDSFADAPSHVLGQTSIGNTQPNLGGRTASTLNTPFKVWSDGTRIAVADSDNNRVLIWNAWPTTNAQPADIVLGQSSMTAGDCNRGTPAAATADTLCHPAGVYSDGTHFYATDAWNNRVLMWDTFPTSNGQPADRALGQPTLNHYQCNNGALSSKAQLCGPVSVHGDGTRIVVGDPNNLRALVWNTTPTTTGQAADVVVGTTGSRGVSSTQFSCVADAQFVTTRLMVVDTCNNRILAWSTVPTSDSQPADYVLGHHDFTHSGIIDNQGDNPMEPLGLDFDNTGHLWVTDGHGHQTVRFPATLPATGAVADYSTVSPQPGNAVDGWDMSRYDMWRPRGVTITDDNHYILSSDGDGSRVVWHAAPPTTNPQPVFGAAVGQPTLTASGSNRYGAAAADTLQSPTSADWDGSHFVIADALNNRVLIWDNMPATGEAADIVLGQTDFTTTTPNTGGVSATSLALPSGVKLDGGRLFVADTNNNRVLIWNTVPSYNHQPADLVLGQSSMYSNSVAATSATSFDHPLDLDVDEGMLVVADSSNNRVLLWDAIPTANTTPADRVIGQPDFAGSGCSSLRTGACWPPSVALKGGRLAVNWAAERVLVYDDVSGPTVSGIADVVAGEQARITWTTDEDASSEVVWDTTPHVQAADYAYSAAPVGRTRTHATIAAPLVSGTTYYYRVVSVDAAGNTTVSAEDTFVASNTTHLQASNGFTDDATIDEATPTKNYGGADEIVVGGGAAARKRALIRFSLDQIPASATLVSATLTLHQTDAGSGTTPTVNALATSGTWSEGGGNGTIEASGTTWNSIDGVDPWSSPGGDSGVLAATTSAPAAAPATMQLDVTTQLGRWITGTDPNDGLLLELSPEATGETRRFASSENADASLRPTLVVQWNGRDTTPPQVANVHTQPISSSSVRVLWDTDEPTTSMLEYGPTTAYGEHLDDPVATNEHSIVLDDLQPSTTYHVRVTATDAQGNLSQSPDGAFRTNYRAEIYATDSTLREDKPGRNNGAQGSLFVGNAGTWQRIRSTLKFDMSGIPPGARITSATARMVLAGEGDTTTPQLQVNALDHDFSEGTGDPVVGPGIIIGAGAVSSDSLEPLLSSSSQHMLLTQAGWWQMTPQTDQWTSTIMYHRRSYDGVSFTDNAQFGHYRWGKNGIALVRDGATAWSAGFGDGTSTLEVASYDAATGSATTLNTVNFPTDVQYLPSIAMADDGTLWVKGESTDGQIWVARSTAPHSGTGWSAPAQVAALTTPAHGMLVSLGSGHMLIVAQDGTQLTSREWDGAAWGAPVAISADAQLPLPWLTRASFGGVPDGSGGAWITYVVSGGGVKAVHYAAGVWSAVDTISMTGTAVTISRDNNGNAPIVLWQDGTALRMTRYAAGSWSVPSVLPVLLPATTSQLSATQPSDESIGVTWTTNNGTWWGVSWYGFALDKPADGATWNTSDGGTTWTTPGADSGAAAVATPSAPNALGGVMNFDLTDEAKDWYDGSAPNHGLLLRKVTENPAVNDWKAFYSSESVNPSLRPTLTVDYDLADVTITQPTSTTAWKPSSHNAITWQVSGSGMTQVEIRYSDDGGATWSHLIDASAPNTGSYDWVTPAAEGSYRVQVIAKNGLGDPVATGESDPFVIDNTPPNPVTDLAAPTPSSHSVLSWTQPSDVGGAGMAHGNYRVYRSTSNGVLGSRIATVPALTYDDNGSLADGTYYYTVIPVDAAGNAQPVGNNQIAVAHDAQQPNAVTTLNAPALTNAAIGLTWTAVTDNGIAGMGTYRVYRSNTGGVLGTLFATVGTTSTTNTPPSDGPWFYTVVPVDLAGNARNAGNNQISVTYDTLPPSATSVALAGGAPWTSTGTVTAALNATGAAEYQLSEDSAFTSASWTAMAASTPFVLSGDGNHIVYARYRDAAGNVSPNVSDSISVDTTAPTTITPAAVSPTQLPSLSWSAASDGSGIGLDYYNVYRSNTSGALGTSIGTTTSTSTTDTPPSDGTWYYTVRAVDLLGNERLVGNTQITVVFDATAPTAVTDPAFTANPTNAPFALSWSAATDATTSVVGYRVYRSASSGPLGSLVASPTSASVTDTPPGEGTWYYTVRAVDGAGNEQTAGNVQVAGVYDTTLPLPNPATATAVADSANQITWTAGVATDNNALHATPYSVDAGTPAWQASRTFTENSLSANTQYTRTVRARDAAGNIRTGTVQAYTLPNAPTGLSVSTMHWAGGTYKLQLGWTAPAGGAFSYNIRSSADGYASVVLNVASLAQVITGLAAETTYTYKVCAVNADGSQEATCTSPTSGTTALPPPASTSASNVTSTSTDLDWPDVTNAAGYRVYLYEDAACSNAVGGPYATATSDWSSPVLSADRYYAYQIRSVDSTTHFGAPSTCSELPTALKRTQLGVSLDTALIDFGHALPGESLDGDITLDVDTYASQGYTVVASLDHQLASGPNQIPGTTSGSVAAPGPWSGTGFGITISSALALEAKWGAGANYAPLDTNPTVIHDTGSALPANTPATTQTVIHYHGEIPPTQAAGAYSAAITLTAVANP